jgi:ABC-type bacteriocin/lantibiotic exporter with double-glycine peptidase domain
MQSKDVNISMDAGISGIRYVSQEVGFLNESIGFNIALRPITDLDNPKLAEVCSRVGILDRISSSKNGFNETVGENGGKLSAGERQRLGIARALFDSPSLLILDEPTSNLDSTAENEVWSALQNLKGQITMLIVSHRKVPDELYDYEIKLKITESLNGEHFNLIGAPHES